MADGFARNPAPLCGSPLARKHNPDRSYLYTSLIVHPKSPRELVESAETCVKSHLRWNSTVSCADAVALEPRKQRSKRALGRVTKLVVLPTDFQAIHKFAQSNMLFRLYSIAAHDNARLKCFDLRCTSTDRARIGIHGQICTREREDGLCSPAKGPPG